MGVKIMNVLIGFVIFITTNTLICLCDFVQDDTELVLAFMLHRHGDRTPLDGSVNLSSNPEEVEILSRKYGYGQLTDVGLRRSYELGKSIRRRYGSYLSPQYNQSEIYIRSTDSPRTKMSVLAVMAAVYPAIKKDNWSDNINWTPVPYTTVPADYDTNFATVNCPVLVNKIISFYTHTQPALQAKYHKVLNALLEITGLNITHVPIMSYMVNDVYVSQKSLGVPLGKEIEGLLPAIADLAAESMKIVYGSKENAPLIAGVLLYDFFKAADRLIAGENVERIQVYSVHDINVYAFIAVTKVQIRQSVPKYNSLYSLELRKVRATGKYIIVPVYFKEPGVDETYLQVEGCDGFCDLENFRTVTADNVMDVDEWRTRCEFNQDNINSSSIC